MGVKVPALGLLVTVTYEVLQAYPYPLMLMTIRFAPVVLSAGVVATLPEVVAPPAALWSTSAHWALVGMANNSSARSGISLFIMARMSTPRSSQCSYPSVFHPSLD